jgi:DNA-binding transcriptional LysR family regulator
MLPNPDDLKLFALVVESGSLTRAASKAHLALAALSVRMQHLEEQLGCTLLTRHARGVVPTEAGLRLITSAKPILAALGQLKQDIQRQPAGTLRLVATTVSITEHLPGPLSVFLQRWPEVELFLEECRSPDGVRALKEHRADIAIVAGNLALDGLVTLPFRTDRLVVAVPPDHLFACREQVYFQELLGERFIGLDEHSGIQSFLNSVADRMGQSLRLTMKMRGFNAILRMVEVGAGVSIVPFSAASRASGVVLLGLGDAWAERELKIAVRAGPLRPAEEALLQVLAQET